MHIRNQLALVGILLVVSLVGQAQAAGFACDSQACACNVNKPKDCDAMKINCAGGKIGSCEPWGNTVICTCTAGLAKPSTKAKINALINSMLRKK
jgi:hypothetical protein